MIMWVDYDEVPVWRPGWRAVLLWLFLGVTGWCGTYLLYCLVKLVI
jgi:hypothetical protein